MNDKTKPYAVYIGVDPGTTGACAALIVTDRGGLAVETLVMPMAGNDIDLGAVNEWLSNLYYQWPQRIAACIEKVASMPGQGVKSVFSFGFNTGVVHGLFAAYGIPRYMVAPTQWQKAVLNFTTKDKAAAIAYCRRVYPQVELQPPGKRMPHSGIADALCIATYLMNS